MSTINKERETALIAARKKQSRVSHKELEAGFVRHLSFLWIMTSPSANGSGPLVWWCHVSPIRVDCGHHCSGLQRASRGWFSAVLHMNSCALVLFVYTSFYWSTSDIVLDITETCYSDPHHGPSIHLDIKQCAYCSEGKGKFYVLSNVKQTPTHIQSHSLASRWWALSLSVL